jgi:hypothetical protein
MRNQHVTSELREVRGAKSPSPIDVTSEYERHDLDVLTFASRDAMGCDHSLLDCLVAFVLEAA